MVVGNVEHQQRRQDVDAILGQLDELVVGEVERQ